MDFRDFGVVLYMWLVCFESRTKVFSALAIPIFRVI